MVAEIWALVISPFVDQWVALTYTDQVDEDGGVAEGATGVARHNSLVTHNHWLLSNQVYCKVRIHL